MTKDTDKELKEELTPEEEVTKETLEEESEENKETSEPSLEEKLQAEISELKDKMMRHAAEFDNYKKRTQKERDELYKTAVCDTIEKMLPVKDNLERALISIADADKNVFDGISMIDKQFTEVLKSAGVEEIKSVGEVFDPERHNAVMHEESDEYAENTITEEFQKGYIYKDEKVIRYSMVKVCN